MAADRYWLARKHQSGLRQIFGANVTSERHAVRDLDFRRDARRAIDVCVRRRGKIFLHEWSSLRGRFTQAMRFEAFTRRRMRAAIHQNKIFAGARRKISSRRTSRGALHGHALPVTASRLREAQMIANAPTYRVL
jgi:hypothetical protein